MSELHTCHPHVAGAAFLVSADARGRPSVVGQQMFCCHCRQSSIQYTGNFDTEHPLECGPGVAFKRPTGLVAANGVLTRGGKA